MKNPAKNFMGLFVVAALLLIQGELGLARAKKANKPQRPSSAEMRQGKEFGVVAEIGLVNVFAFGSGIRGMMYLDSNRLIEAGFFQAEFSFLGYATKYQMIEGRYKHIVGNSFYYFAGVASQTVTSTKPDFFESEGSELSATHLAAEGGIGNHWSWSGFTMGCDWVGLAYPLVELASSESFPDDGKEEDIESDRDSFDEQASGANLMNVRFYLGMHF
jgi:hypothetical protein